MSFEDALKTGGTERGPGPLAPGEGSPTLPSPGAPTTPIGSYPYTQQPAQGGYWPAGTERTPFQAPVVTGNRDVDVAIEPITGIHHRTAQAFAQARDKLLMPGLQDLAKGDLSGLAGVVPGAAGMVFAPVGGMLEPVSRPINEYAAPVMQSVFGTPPEITTPVLTALVPGLGITKVPGAPRAPITPYVRPKGPAPKVEPTAPKMPSEAAEAPAAKPEPTPPAAAPGVPPEVAKKVDALDKRIAKVQRGIEALSPTDVPPEVLAELKGKLDKMKAQRDELTAVTSESAPLTESAPDTLKFEDAPQPEVPTNVPGLKAIEAKQAKAASQIEKLQARITKAEDEGRDTTAAGLREKLTATQEAFQALDDKRAALIQKHSVPPPSVPVGESAPPPPVPPSRGGGSVPPEPPAGAPPEPPASSVPPIPPGKPIVKPGILDYLKRMASNIEKLVSPTTVDAHAQTAEALLREAHGAGARDLAQADAALEAYKAQVNRMPEAQQYDLIDYMETRDQAPTKQVFDISLQPVADVMRDLLKKMRVQLESMPPTEKMRFIEEYFPHQWADDPETIAQFFAKREGVGKEGKSGFTKKRSIPTVTEGLKAGLRLKNPNPLEAVMTYMDNAVKYIAQGRVFSQARELGLAKFFTPGKQPDGWMELSGRYGGKLTQVGQMRAYAPEGFARVYNNAISPKFTGPGGELIQGLQQASNWATGLELGLSGFHALTMTQEAMVSGVASAIRQLYTGHPVSAAGALIKAPLNAAGYAFTGGRMQRIYAGGKYKSAAYQTMVEKLTPRAARLHKVVDLLTKAGGRAVKIDKEYLASRQGSYVKAFKHAALGKQLKADIADIKAKPITGTAAFVARHMARIVDTVSAPMFSEWIPRLKLGAFDEHMSGWLRRNPNATEAQQIAAAREIWDSVDNRFGEMVRDNIFWKNTYKQALQIMLRSYTWTFGAGREIAGGVWDTAKLPYKATQAAGKYLEGKTVTAKDMPKITQRMDYVLALPLVYATWNAVLTYLYTGEQPEGQDFVAGRTGGVDTSSGQPERVVAPGFMKDVFGWTEKGIPGELYNKTATVPRTLLELSLNKDWRGLPIAPGSKVDDPEAPSWLNEYAQHVFDNLGPFSIKNIIRGQKEGSNIGPVETVLGLQPAGKAMTDKEGYEGTLRYLQSKEWQRKLKADGREQSKYKGPQ